MARENDDDQSLADWKRAFADRLRDAPEVSPSPFDSGEPTQRIHDADARVGFGVAIVLVFILLAGFEAYGCFGEHLCKDLHDVKDTFEPFAYAVFTAFGAAAGFFFATREG